jgi:hypothetical protein
MSRQNEEERAHRTGRTIYLISLVLWAAILGATYCVGKAEPAVETPKVETVIVQTAPESVFVPLEEEPEVEFNPVREDIPLDEETQRLLYQACDETGIQYELALAVIWQETDFRNIVGDGGDSTGYMQVQEKWHKDRMERLGVTDLSDPYSNFLVGCDYLAELIAKDRGLEWALMAYNGGPTYANKKAKEKTISQYAKNVLNYTNILTTEEN